MVLIIVTSSFGPLRDYDKENCCSSMRATFFYCVRGSRGVEILVKGAYYRKHCTPWTCWHADGNSFTARRRNPMLSRSMLACSYPRTQHEALYLSSTTLIIDVHLAYIPRMSYCSCAGRTAALLRLKDDTTIASSTNARPLRWPFTEGTSYGIGSFISFTEDGAMLNCAPTLGRRRRRRPICGISWLLGKAMHRIGWLFVRLFLFFLSIDGCTCHCSAS
jgi:hypothetical protein